MVNTKNIDAMFFCKPNEVQKISTEIVINPKY
jgi:hypothetical protein